MKYIKAAMFTAAEILVCGYLPVGLWNTSGSDTVGIVSIAVCALMLGPMVFSFFYRFSPKNPGGNFSRIYLQARKNRSFDHIIMISRLIKQTKRRRVCKASDSRTRASYTLSKPPAGQRKPVAQAPAFRVPPGAITSARSLAVSRKNEMTCIDSLLSPRPTSFRTGR